MSAPHDHSQQIAAWNATLVGVLGLLARSPVHRGWRVSDVERLILPPLALGQCVVLWERGQAVAFASYARLSEEAEAGYEQGTRLLQPGDWSAGDRLWLVDVVAPFGHARKATALLRKLLRMRGFEGREIRFRRTYAGKAGRRYARVTI